MATLVKGCVFGEIQIWISDSKNESWSLKSTLWVESRIKSKSGFLRFTIWAFFWERIWRKYFWQAVFRTKMFDFLTDPMLMAPLLWAIGYISFRVCHLFTFVDYFITLTCPVFCTYVVSAYARLFSKFKKRKNNSSANSVRCFLLGKRLTFKPKYAHFVHSYVSLRRFTFLSSPRESCCFSSIFLITRSTRTCRCQCLVPRRLSFDVRAKEGGKKTTGETALRPPSVRFPWSLAVHHRSLAFRARLCNVKNEAPEEEAAFAMVNDPQFSDLPFFWQWKIHMIWDHKSVFGISKKYEAWRN